MYLREAVLLLLVIFYGYITQIDSKVEFTNIKCISKDKSFFEFEYCYIKSVNRSYKYISLKTNMYQLPIKNASATLQLFKRFRSYTPITMNVTVDVCKYMASNMNSGNPMLKLYAEATKKYSNVHHKCPFDHDLVVDKLPTQFLNQHFTTVLPLPPGDYAFFSSWYVRGVERGNIWIYGIIS
ncbi:uncharacterized protein LOC108099241 [Drosophila ficusphila]|uniref:uncharacterized protein LOC108099241 n=1 Tax=Drosophila ficusphila TaxID=30025 RepID=UPI0007E83335|nr:uncharacterized protein LOC108099241 [Drosophila ficusphila]